MLDLWNRSPGSHTFDRMGSAHTFSILPTIKDLAKRDECQIFISDFLFDISNFSGFYVLVETDSLIGGLNSIYIVVNAFISAVRLVGFRQTGCS